MNTAGYKQDTLQTNIPTFRVSLNILKGFSPSLDLKIATGTAHIKPYHLKF